MVSIHSLLVSIVYALSILKTNDCLLEEVEDVFSISKDIASTVFKTWETVSEHMPERPEEITPPFLRKRGEKLVAKMKLISQKMQDIDGHINFVTLSAVSSLRKDFHAIAHYELRVNEVFRMIGTIEDAYLRFQSYLPSSGGGDSDSLSHVEEQLEMVNEEMPGTNIRLRHKHISLDPGNVTEISYSGIGVYDDSSNGDARLDDDSAVKVVVDHLEGGQKSRESHQKLTKTNVYEPYTLESFAHATVSHQSDSVLNVLNSLAFQLNPRAKRGFYISSGFLHFVAKNFQEGDSMMCSVDQSLQQLIFNLYTYMHMVQLKGYVMMQFSWMLLRLYGKGNFTTESLAEKHKFNKQFEEQIKIALQVLETTNNNMQKCDPHKFEEGENYVQITRLLQGYIQNEVDMNPENSCSENCKYYSYAKQHSCFKNKFCARQTSCSGRIIDCQYIDSDMGVCMSEIGSLRRYNWVQYENGRVLGKRNSCPRYSTVDSWWRWLVLHCSYCFCLCDEPGRLSDRYFSLRHAVSNTTTNKVVTGVRFVKRNRIIHLQIQQGELLPHGGINQTTVSWKPVPDYRIDDLDVKEGVDYHTLSWENRALDLDDVDLPKNCLLTGVRLRKLGSHLNLEAECSRFDPSTGKLIKPEESKMWIGNDNTDGAEGFPRERLELLSPDVPTNAPAGCTNSYSSSNMFVEFRHSDIDADAAQTTVPFIDIQPVAPHPPLPLVGVGLYHRGCDKFGGFVAPKVMTYDASQHLADFVSDESKK